MEFPELVTCFGHSFKCKRLIRLWLSSILLRAITASCTAGPLIYSAFLSDLVVSQSLVGYGRYWLNILLLQLSLALFSSSPYFQC